MGGNLGGTGETAPTFDVGDGPCIRPPNILRNSVVRCVRKYELSKKGVMKEFCYEIELFREERAVYVKYHI